MNSNFIQQINNQRIQHSKEEQAAVRNEANNKCHLLVCAFNTIAYEEYLKLHDLLEENNMVRHKIKRQIKQYDRLHEKYLSMVKWTYTHIVDGVPNMQDFYLWSDIQNEVYKLVEQDIDNVTESIAKDMEKEGVKDCRLKAQAMMCYQMTLFAANYFERFFHYYIVYFRMDMRQTFKHTNFEPFVGITKILTDEVCHDNRTEAWDFSDQTTAYMEKLHDKLASPRFHNDAYELAVELNRTAMPEKYEKYLYYKDQKSKL